MPDTFKVRVLVRPKSGILDPQGEAVRRALPALGFKDVKTVHIGRLVEMEVDSADEVEGMCKRLLANPTIEEYEWEVVQ
jgi:phosphoribosylformylglycinamidine synthase subunit PurS